MTRYSAPQILAILRQAGSGVPVSDLCREHGMHGLAEYCETMFERGNASFYKWRSKYGVMPS
jgi:putative transposase